MIAARTVTNGTRNARKTPSTQLSAALFRRIASTIRPAAPPGPSQDVIVESPGGETFDAHHASVSTHSLAGTLAIREARGGDAQRDRRQGALEVDRRLDDRIVRLSRGRTSERAPDNACVRPLPTSRSARR